MKADADDFVFSHNGASGAESKRIWCQVEFIRGEVCYLDCLCCVSVQISAFSGQIYQFYWSWWAARWTQCWWHMRH